MNVLIAGSSSGIGAGLAKYFSSKRDNVCITFNASRAKAKKVYSEVKKLHPQGKHLLSQLNVLSMKSALALSKNVAQKWGSIDLLIVNAGVDYDSPFEKMSLDDWETIFHTKTDGSFITTKALFPLLKKSTKSNLVYISASVGWKPDWRDPAYSSASAAIMNFGQSLAVALSKYGIRTNVICPGPTKTNLKYWREVEKVNPAIWEDIKKSNPLKALCEVEDVGSLIHYIARVGTYINGNVIFLDGGAHLR
jgi:NAD(P)-dependent dehydrogenase (short-subunit alcohol dehydrogenase family)